MNNLLNDITLIISIITKNIFYRSQKENQDFTLVTAVDDFHFEYLENLLENYKKVKNINIPILVMHGEIDQIVPFSMGKKIYEMANKPKYSYFTKYDNHMMEFDDKLILALKSFIKSLN